jgi:hypothetical protein
MVTLEVLNPGTNGGDPHSRLGMKALVVDGRLLRWESTKRSGGWVLEDGAGQPSNLFFQGPGNATLAFGAARLIAILQPVNWSGLIRVKRNGRPVQMMDVASQGPSHPIAIEDPAAPKSAAVFVGALILFGGCAWWFGPWNTRRKSIPWLVFFLSVIHLLYWASQPIGTNNDSEGYFNAASEVFHGSPPGYPPGYGFLLTAVEAVAGENLGSWTTLLQHGMVVLGAVWLYLLFRKIMSEELALTGAILAGVLTPTFTVTQGLMSEPSTSFAMIAALYFAVRSNETGKIIFAALAGIFVGWAGLLRVVPLAALLPAIGILYLFPWRKSRLRQFTVTAAIAACIFLSPLVWCGYKSGQPKLTNSVGLHLYNRVITEQKLLDKNGPATQRLLGLIPGKDPSSYRHWELTAQDAIRTLPSSDQELLLRRVSMEGIATDPAAFVVYTFRLAWRTFWVPTDWIATWADTIPVFSRSENPPPLAFTASSLQWRWSLENIHMVIWPVVCWAAIAGTLLGLSGQNRLWVLAMAWVPIGYLLPTACADVFCPRYNAPLVPFVAVLAMLPLEWIRRVVWEPAFGSAAAPLETKPAAVAVTAGNTTEIVSDTGR